MKLSDSILQIAAVGAAGFGLYMYSRWQASQEVSPPPVEPPGGYTPEYIDGWFKGIYPDARRLSDAEAAAMEVTAGWAALMWAGTKPVKCEVVFLEGYKLTCGLDVPPVIIPGSVGGVEEQIDTLVGNFKTITPSAYVHAGSPPLFWERWDSWAKVGFIGLVEAIAWMIPPSPPDAAEAAYRRAEYYMRLANTRVAAILWQHRNYKGFWLEVTGDIPDLSWYDRNLSYYEQELRINDEVSSLWIQRTYCAVYVYQHTNYEGKFMLLAHDTPSLTTYNLDLNDKVSSVRLLIPNPYYS